MKSSKLPNCPRLYVGIDQSVVCTSFAILVNGEMIVKRFKTDLRGPKLLKYLYEGVWAELLNCKPTGVAIEGYAFGGKGKVYTLGEVGGVIRLAAQQLETPLIQVPPTTLKKYISGTGKATKDIMIKEIYKNYDLDFNDNNDADAAGLAILAHEFYETEYHCVKAYEHDLHKTCDMIVGDHPNRMNYKEYLKGMPDHINLATWEKVRKGIISG